MGVERNVTMGGFLLPIIFESDYNRTTNLSTVNSEIFASVLFSRNFAYAKFRENKIRDMGRSLCRLLIKVNHAWSRIANVANI